jgi:release factor glutamine methyltransferase
MTLDKARSWITQELLRTYSPPEAALLAQQLLSWALKEPFSHSIITPKKPLPEPEQRLITEILRDHLEDHKPLQYCMGTVPFMSATIQVHPPILIPRPETEWWVDLMIRHLKKGAQPHMTLLDMGTGSGCIAIALAQAFPNSLVYGVDINPVALALAQKNALHNKCQNITFIQSDLFENLSPSLRFDCILSNPPYIDPVEFAQLEPNVRLWEDPHALIAEAEGYALLTQIIKEAPHWLRRNPLFGSIPQLALEIGHQQAEKVTSQMRASGFIPTVHTDIADKDRMIAGELSYE